jgi:alkylhydroperoxidase/carboxymuconolactone decarboxylase family protein YurZ
MLGKRTPTAGDIRAVLAAGVSREQIEDALAVGFAFNVTDRLANAFAFQILDRKGFEAGAKYLLKRGYG